MAIFRETHRAIWIIPTLLALLSISLHGSEASAEALPEWSSSECLRIVTAPNRIYEPANEQQAWRLLIRRQYPEATTLLLAQLSDASDDIRLAAAKRLGGISDPRAAQGLLTALRDRCEYVRGAAAASLGRLQDLTAVDTLMLMAERDRSLEVRHAAISALGEIGDARAIPLLVKTMQQKDVAGGLLRAYGSIKAAVLLYPHYAESSRPNLRYAAMTSLGKMGSEAVGPLLVLLQKKPDAHICAMAISALGSIGDRRAADTLVNAISDRHRLVRYGAAQALARIPDARAIPALAKMLTADDSRYAIVAIEALGATGNSQAAALLLEYIGNKQEDWCVNAALLALANIHDSSVLPAIIAMSTDSRYLTEQMVKALGAYDDPRAVQALLSMLKNPAAHGLEDQIFLALGRSGNTMAVTPLCALLQKGSFSDHPQLIRAIGMIGDTRALPWLSALPIDEEPTRRALATIWARWKLGASDEATLQKIVAQCVMSTDIATQLEAIRICGELTDAASLALLNDNLRDPYTESYIVEAAGKALAERLHGK